MALWNFCQHRTIWGWKFQNATSPTFFIQSRSNFMRNTTVIGEYKVMVYIGESYGTYRIPSKRYENIAYHRVMQAITLLGNRPRFTKFMSRWNFNIGVNGEPKMWEVSKTADRRVKRTKIWDSGVLQCTYVGYFLLRHPASSSVSSNAIWMTVTLFILCVLYNFVISLH